MASLKVGLTSLALITLALGASCSDNTDPEKDIDGSVAVVDIGTTNLPDGYVLHECNIAGEACNAHDPCAIDPVCGPDLKCRPTSLQNCNDELECTMDTCLGMGECSYETIPDYCALAVKKEDGTTATECFKDGDRSPQDPCQVCNSDPDNGNPIKWLPGNGGSCDDEDPCTRDDYCDMGQCTGEDYRADCDDELSCTQVICDGNGGCGQPELMSDWCLINGECFRNEDRDEGGCNECVVATSQSQWTPLAGPMCNIDGVCFKPGETDKTGCGSCDPTADPSGWTMASDKCLIEEKCYTAGDTHSEGCATCNPVITTTDWTVDPDSCLLPGLWYDTCMDAGATDSSGCATCDPTQNDRALTPLPDMCLIDEECYARDAPDSTNCGICDPDTFTTRWTLPAGVNKCLIADDGCFEPEALNPQNTCVKCDPALDRYAWSPVANKCLIGATCYDNASTDSTGCLVCNYAQSPKTWLLSTGVNGTLYNFEDNVDPPTGWTIEKDPPGISVGWNVSNRRPWTGTYSLYYGDPATGDYDTGDIHTGRATTPPITLTAGKKAGVSFLIYIDTETSSLWDKVEVYVTGNSNSLWEKDSSSIDMKAWTEVKLDLSGYAGQTITLEFYFDTVDDTVNETEGVFIDNIVFYENC